MSVIGEAFVAVSPESEGFEQKLKAQLLGGGGLAGIGGLLGVAAAGAVIAGLADIGEKFQAVTHQIQQETGATGAELKGLFTDVTTVFSEVPAKLGDVTTAVDELRKRGIPLGDTLDKLAEQELFLAKITKTDLGTNVEQTTALFAKFNVPVKAQSAELDVLFKASQQSGKGIGDLLAAVAGGGATFKAFGFSLDQSISLVAGLEKAGINVQPALASLRRAFSTIAKEGQDPQTVLKGITAELRSGVDPTKAMADALKLFGARGGLELATALKEGKFSVDGLIKSITDGKGGIIATGKATETLGEKVDLLKNRALVALQPIGSAVLAAFETGFEAATPVIEHLGESIGNFAKSLLPLIEPLGPLIGDVFRLALPVVDDFATGIGTIATGLAAIPAPVTAAAIAFGGLAFASNAAGTGFLLSATSVRSFVASLISGSAAVVGADAAVVSSLTLQAVAADELTAAQARQVASNTAVLESRSAVAAAEQAEVATSLQLTAAEQALADIQFQLAAAVDVDVESLTGLVAAKDAVVAADTALADASATVAGLLGETATAAAAAATTLGELAGITTVVSGSEQLAAVSAARLTIARGAEADATTAVTAAQAAFAAALLAVQTAEAGDVVAAQALVVASEELAAAQVAVAAAVADVEVNTASAAGVMGVFGAAIDVALGPVGLIVAGVAALGLATHFYGNTAKDATTDTSSLSSVFDATSNNAADLTGRISGLNDELLQFLKTQLTSGKQEQQGVIALHAFGLSYDDLANHLGDSTDQFDAWANALRNNLPATKDNKAAVNDFSQVLNDTRTSLESSAQAAIKHAIATGTLTQAQADQVLAQHKVKGSLDDLDVGTTDYLNALKDLAPTIDAQTAKQQHAAVVAAQATTTYRQLVDGLAQGTITTADAAAGLAQFGIDADTAKTNVADLQKQIAAFVSAVQAGLPGTADAAKQFATDVSTATSQLTSDQQQHVSLLQQLQTAGSKASAGLLTNIQTNNAAIRKDMANLAADQSPQKFVENLLKQAAGAQTFFNNIKILVAEGFGQLAGQLLQLGPAAAGGLAQGLASDKSKAATANAAATLLDNTNASLLTFAKSNFAQLNGIGEDMGTTIATGMASGIDKATPLVGVAALRAAAGARAALNKGFVDFHDDGVVLGTQLGDGLDQGLGSTQVKINGTASRVAHGVIHVLGSSLQIKSPSEASRQFGIEIGNGLALGMDQSRVKVDNAAHVLAATALKPLTPDEQKFMQAVANNINAQAKKVEAHSQLGNQGAGNFASNVPNIGKQVSVKVDLHKVDVNPFALAQEIGWRLG